LSLVSCSTPLSEGSFDYEESDGRSQTGRRGRKEPEAVDLEARLLLDLVPTREGWICVPNGTVEHLVD
jgi:hypothetical protein